MKLSQAAPPEGTVRDWLDARAASDGVAVVLPDTGETMQWSRLRDGAQAFAAQLTSIGCEKGESIAIVAPNGIENLLAFFGALYGGFRATMINLAAGRDAIAYALDHSEARFGYVHTSCEALFSAANESGIVALPLHGQSSAQLYEIDAEDDALLMYTSGTTGRPKGVLHSHASLLAGGWTTAVAHDLGPQDRGFCVLPVYHINGLCVTVMGSLVSGGSFAIAPKFSATRFWDQADSAGITWFSVVPTIISHLLHGEADPTQACRDRIRFGRSASSALAVETQASFENRFNIPIIETMGLTETAAQILSNPMPPGPRKIGSPGVAFGCEVKIVDGAGAPIPCDTEGEIVVRGPNVMRGYLKNPEATSDAFREGWLRSGDLARMDADGYVYVTGRLKELIIKGGENIAPREVDEALYTHPDVVEAAAFARACARYGETIEAAVRVREGSGLTSATLLRICQERLGPFKTPDTVHFLNELPKGPSGKIQRLKLATLIATP